KPLPTSLHLRYFGVEVGLDDVGVEAYADVLAEFVEAFLQRLLLAAARQHGLRLRRVDWCGGAATGLAYDVILEPGLHDFRVDVARIGDGEGGFLERRHHHASPEEAQFAARLGAPVVAVAAG